MKTGQLAVKIAGKDAGKTVVVIDNVDDNFVMIDGQVKRKRCNVMHLEPLEKEIKIKKNAPHEEIVNAFKELKIKIEDGTKKRKERSEKAAGKVRRASANKPADSADTRAAK